MSPWLFSRQLKAVRFANLILPWLSRRQLTAAALIGCNSLDLTPAKAFPFPASKMVTPAAQLRMRDPTDLLRRQRGFHLSLVSAIAAFLQTFSLAPPPAAVSKMTCPGQVSPLFSCFPNISVFATGTVRNGWLVLDESRHLPFAATTGSRATFRLVSRANGQPTRRNLDVHVLGDNTFTSSESSSAS